jgi:hypothetical protein
MKPLSTLLVAAALFLSGPARGAEVQEYLTCRLHDGKTMQDLSAALDKWRVAANQAGYADLKVKILQPIHAADTRPGVFYWQGVWKDYARMGLGWNWWLGSPEAAEAAAALTAVYVCERDEVTIVVLEK